MQWGIFLNRGRWGTVAKEKGGRINFGSGFRYVFNP